MSDDPLIDRIRHEAQALRYEPEGEQLERLQARVRTRIGALAAPPTVAQLLVAWMRPVATALAGLAVAASIVAATEQQPLREWSSAFDAVVGSADASFHSEEMLGVE